MYIQEVLSTKKADFYSDKIVWKKKKGDVVVLREEIDFIQYTRPTFFNYFIHLIDHVTAPGQLVIHLKRDRRNGKKPMYWMYMKYEEFLRLPYDMKMLLRLW